MKSLLFKIFFLIVLLNSCGSSEQSSYDVIAFTKSDSSGFYTMGLKGENVEQLEVAETNADTWVRQKQLINGACMGTSPDSPITLISPDGAQIGTLDDSWSPEWSPDGQLAAFACGADDEGKVFLVSNQEVPGSTPGWSRDGKGFLSDRMDVRVISRDGSSLQFLTSNDAGDWLPKWGNNGLRIVLESNRNGNSDIYIHDLSSTMALPLAYSSSNEQSPSWSRDFSFVAFSNDESGMLEIQTLEFGSTEINPTGQYGRPVIWP